MLNLKKTAVLGVWALTLAAAFALGRSIAPGAGTVDQPTAPAAGDPAPEDLATAIAAALGEPDVLDRIERTAHLLRQLGPENVAAVAEVYDRRLNILGELSIRPFAAAWARFDPEAAFDHIIHWPYNDKREIGAPAVMEAWALRDPVAALETFERVADQLPSLRDPLFFDLLTGWFYSGQGGIDDYIENLPIGRRNIAITRVAANTLRTDGVDALIDWVNAIAANDDYENRFKRTAFQRGVRMVARMDPERAAGWALENRNEAPAYDAPRIVTEQWGLRDGRAALEWVRNNPPPTEEMQYQACREGFKSWFSSNRADAVAWLDSETLTAFHDPAIEFYAKEIGMRTPEKAVEWCERVHDDERGTRCLKRAAALWYKRDAVAAETWLQQSPLDEETRSEVRAPLTPTQKVERRKRQRGQPPP